jgi:KaiC/GvpD/RAD55 family RecA-like ATPase
MTAVPSGIPDVDRQWGGFASGQAYLLVGRAGAGRSALALQAAQAAVDGGARCLLISPREPGSLVEIGRGVGFDLAEAHGAGRLRLLRIPAPADLAARGAEGLAQSYRDLVQLVATDGPDRVVVEDFTPLVQFDTFERFREAFSELLDALREADVTLVIGLGDPANDASHRLLGEVEALVAGAVRLGEGGALALSPPAGETPEGSAGPDDAEDVPAAAEPELAEPAPSGAPPEGPGPLAGTDGASVPTSGPVVAAPAGAPAPTEIVPAPSVPGDLLHAPEAPFGADPIEAIMEQGFLADSGPIPASAAPTETAVVEQAEDPAVEGHEGDHVLPTQMGLDELATFPAVDEPSPAAFEDGAPALGGEDALAAETGAPVAQEPAAQEPAAQKPAAQEDVPEPTPAPLPAFVPLGQPPAPPDPAAAFRQSLQAAFDARDGGAPFLTVAVRMDPAAPEAAHFGAVESGLRSALRDADRLLVDAERRRAVALLPGSGAEAGQALFAALQGCLHESLGAEAAAVLAAVGAVTIPNGEPFTGAADLLAYTFES